MSSKVELCSFALQEVGATPITSLNEGTQGADECKLRYDSARLALLRLFDWDFAIGRVLLARKADTPAFGYKYEFALPSDFVRLSRTKEDEARASDYGYTNNPIYIEGIGYSYNEKYKIEGRNLLSDRESVGIVYVKDVVDTSLFDSLFSELLVRLLSAKIARRITGSADEANKQMKLFLTELEEAGFQNAQENTFEVISEDNLINVRA